MQGLLLDAIYSCKLLLNVSVYTGTVKRHNVCKRYIATDTGVKQTQPLFFFFFLFQWDKN